MPPSKQGNLSVSNLTALNSQVGSSCGGYPTGSELIVCPWSPLKDDKQNDRICGGNSETVSDNLIF